MQCSSVVSSSPIALLDSGLGGLSVLKEVSKLLPNERFLYIADTARLPYGSRSAEEIVAFTYQMIHVAINMGAKLILIACNTSSASLSKEAYSNFSIPVLDIISPFTSAMKDLGGTTAVMATPLTIASSVYQNMIFQYMPSIKVIEIPCQMLVPIIENEAIPIWGMESILSFYLRPATEANVKAIIYGCSHYALLDKEIRQILGNATNIFDPAKYFAKYVERYINERQPEERSAKANAPDDVAFHLSVNCESDYKNHMNTRFFSTGDPLSFALNMSKFLSFEANVEQIIFED